MFMESLNLSENSKNEKYLKAWYKKNKMNSFLNLTYWMHVFWIKPFEPSLSLFNEKGLL